MIDVNKLQWAARVGYLARGAVYVLIGSFALAAAFGLGAGDATQGSREALGALVHAPAGRLALGAVALGLLGYAAWRTTQAVENPDGHDDDLAGVTIRAAMGVSAAIHLSLAVYAAKLALASGDASPGGGSRGLVAELLSHPAGQWLVAGVALAIAGTGIAHIVKGWKAGFLKYFEETPTWSVNLCRFGLAARGVVFLVVAGLFLRAAVSADPQQAGGVESALDLLRGAGTVAFSVIAAGLFAFGVYSVLEAWYRRIGDPSSRASEPVDVGLESRATTLRG